MEHGTAVACSVYSCINSISYIAQALSPSPLLHYLVSTFTAGFILQLQSGRVISVDRLSCRTAVQSARGGRGVAVHTTAVHRSHVGAAAVRL